jgi:hypothetical protein
VTFQKIITFPPRLNVVGPCSLSGGRGKERNIALISVDKTAQKLSQWVSYTMYPTHYSGNQHGEPHPFSNMPYEPSEMLSQTENLSLNAPTQYTPNEISEMTLNWLASTGYVHPQGSMPSPQDEQLNAWEATGPSRHETITKEPRQNKMPSMVCSISPTETLLCCADCL